MTEHLLALQQGGRRAPVARALGVSPFDEEQAAWCRGALVEAAAGRLVERAAGRVSGAGGAFTSNAEKHS